MKIRDEFRFGDWNIVCDRTGKKKKRSECRREWTGSIVDAAHFEYRHPQDFIHGIKDDQSVPDARFLNQVFTGNETTLGADELPGQTVLSVASTSNMTIGDTIVVSLDNDENHLSTISSFVPGDTVTIASAIPAKASSGNKVVIYSNQVLVSDL